MQTSYKGIALLRQFEGLKLASYKDSAGVWTIGYGHTKGVKQGDVITSEQADAYLLEDLLAVEQCINDCVNVELTQNQADALASFVFNTAAHECEKFRTSALCARLNARQYAEAGKQMLRWNQSNGKIIMGLVKRRKIELELFDSVV